MVETKASADEAAVVISPTSDMGVAVGVGEALGAGVALGVAVGVAVVAAPAVMEATGDGDAMGAAEAVAVPVGDAFGVALDVPPPPHPDAQTRHASAIAAERRWLSIDAAERVVAP
jgi:hypothetical protein